MMSSHSAKIESLSHIIKRIRKEYRKDVPILVLADAGFYLMENFDALEKLNVAYICGGRVYDGIKELVESIGESNEYKGKGIVWEFVDFIDKIGKWELSRCAIYLKPFVNSEKKPSWERKS